MRTSFTIPTLLVIFVLLQRLEEAAAQRDDEDFLPDEAERESSDDEYSNLSPAVRALMQKYVCFLTPAVTRKALMHGSIGCKAALAQDQTKRTSLYAPRYTMLLGHIPS